MREDTELPIHSLARGFSNPAEEEESSDKEDSSKSEKLKADKSYKRVRRAGDCKINCMKNKCATSLNIFSANCASLKNGKLASLNAEVNSTEANIITLQETHYKEKGKIKLNKDFVVFEGIRVKKGGGTAIAIHEDLKPKLIEEQSY